MIVLPLRSAIIDMNYTRKTIGKGFLDNLSEHKKQNLLGKMKADKTQNIPQSRNVHE